MSIKKTYIPAKPRSKKLIGTSMSGGVAGGVFSSSTGSTDPNSHTHPNKRILDQLTQADINVLEKLSLVDGNLRIDANAYSTGNLSAFGLEEESGGSGGGSMNMMQTWSTSVETENYYLPAKLAVPFYDDTRSRLTVLEAGTAPASHTHPISDITGLQTALNSKLETSIFNTHNNDNVRHITGAERTKWDGVVTDFAGLEIGGRNLAQLDYLNAWAGVRTGVDDFGAYHEINGSTDYRSDLFPLINYGELQRYTLSFYFRDIEESLDGLTVSYTDGSSEVIFRAHLIAENTEDVYKVIFTTQKNKTVEKIYRFYGTARWIRYYYFKLEKGTKATDWTPAPEDQVSDWDTTDVNSFSFIKNKPTTLSGYGITDAYTKTQVDSSLALKLNKLTFDDLFEKVETSAGKWAVKVKYNLFSVGEISAFGAEESEGGSGGGSMSMMQDWTIPTGTENYYLPAKLAVPFYDDTRSRLSTLEAGTAPASHTHTISDITNLQTALNSKLETTVFNTHNTDNIRHITGAERTKWDNAFNRGDFRDFGLGNTPAKRLNDLGAVNDDINTLPRGINAFIYPGDTALNTPGDSNDYPIGLRMSYNVNIGTTLLFGRAGNDKMWFRNDRSRVGNFKPWREVWHTGNLTSLSQLSDNIGVATHNNDNVRHITGAERTKWDGVVTDFAELEIGGRNLLRDSDTKITLSGSDRPASRTHSFTNGVSTITYNSAGGNLSAYGWLQEYLIDANIANLHNAYITLSVDVKTNSDGFRFSFNARDSSHSNQVSSKAVTTFDTKNEWVRISSTLFFPDDSLNRGRILGSFSGNSNLKDGEKIEFRNFKLEKGNKATDWTPAPEDQVSDWNTTDVDSFSFIKNKPTMLSQFTDNIGIGSHIANKANPHNVTKAQVGLGNVTNESKLTMFANPTFTGTTKVTILELDSSWKFVKVGDNIELQFDGVTKQIMTNNGDIVATAGVTAYQ